MSYYSDLSRLRHERQRKAEKIWSQFLCGAISRRSLVAYMGDRSTLFRAPDWIDDEEGYSVCYAAGNWLRATYVAWVTKNVAPLPCDSLTDCMERGGAITAEEASRRREVAAHRHEATNYDELLASGVDRDTARQIATRY